MKTIFIIAIALTCIFLESSAQQDSAKTSTTLQILPRFHTAGYFPFTGALLNRNPVADVNIFYERKALGFFLFQSLDLKDRHSYANYFQPGVFATLKLHRAFKVRGFFGYIFSQTRGFRDADSDYYAATTLYWDPTEHISIQNTVLFYDYNIQRKLANRLLVSWQYPKFKVDLFVWNRLEFAEKRQAISASLAVTFPVIKLSDKTSIHITSAYMRYLTSYKPGFALDDGLIFTVAVPVNIRP
jgi:hypothetical protein